MFRIAILILAAGLLSGGTYLSWSGYGTVSSDLSAPSVRTGSGGGGVFVGGGRIK